MGQNIIAARKRPPNLLERLRGVDLAVLAPDTRSAGAAFGGSVVDAGRHADLLRQVNRLRASSISPPAPPGAAGQTPTDPRDPACWHILGVTRDDQAVVGAIRMRVYDLAGGVPAAVELLGFSDVAIPDPDVRAAIEATLADYAGRQLARSGYFFQVGGFAVAPSHRGTALAPLLALGVNAWFEALGLDAGCTFATLVNNVASFDLRLGGCPMTARGAEPPEFYCANHRAGGKLIAIEPGRYEPRFRATVRALGVRFAGAEVVAPR